MFKLLEAFLDQLDSLSKSKLRKLYGLLSWMNAARAFSLTKLAKLSRRFGARAIIVTGIIFSSYALYLFLVDSLSKDTTKPIQDAILRNRLSSPKPSASIVIVDIDERSLAALAGRHGRWPWSRDVLADGLQKLTELGARAILFNIMISDPDKSNPDADAALDVTSHIVHQIAFPIIRLDPKNDPQSKLKVSQIIGSRVKTGISPEPTIAAVLPMFGSMHDRLGVANQRPDKDGILRRYSLVWGEANFELPSIVKQTIDVGGTSTDGIPSTISLNWRNKHGRYVRISYSDLRDAQPQDPTLTTVKGAYIVLGVSAPGLGQTKGTAVIAVEDDNEILATALDDAIHDTYLRTMPAWLQLLMNLVTIWVLVWMSITSRTGGFINRLFVVAQASFGGITLLSASYTNYIIDLSDSMSFGLVIFSAIKLIQSLDDRWSRARPGFRKESNNAYFGDLLIIGYLHDRVGTSQSNKLQKLIESIVGLTRVIKLDDLFGGESFLKSSCARFHCLLVLADEAQIARIIDIVRRDPYSAALFERHRLSTPWNPESHQFSSEVAPLVLACGHRLFDNEWIACSPI